MRLFTIVGAILFFGCGMQDYVMMRGRNGGGGPALIVNSPSDVRIQGDLGGMSLGYSSALGDINGDERPDLVLGGPNRPGGGRVYVVFGTSQGLPNPLVIDQLNGTNGFTIDDAPWNSGIGASVNVADFNGDGVGDIAMGSGANDVYVLFGHSNPWASSVNVGSLTGTDGTDIYSASNIALGRNVKSADLNGDSIKDIVLNDTNINGGDGRVYVIFGHTGAWAATIDPNALNGTDGLRLISSTAGTFGLGSALVTGDFSRDGIDDLVVGNFVAAAGEVFAVFGHTGAWAASTNMSTALTGANGFSIAPNDAGIGLGASLGFGDFNGDGKKDLTIGAMHAFFQAAFGNSGSVYVLYGGPTGWNANYTTSALISGNLASRVDGPEVDPESFAYGLEVLDFDYDGKADLVVPCPTCSVTGAVYILYGNSNTPYVRQLGLSSLSSTEGLIVRCSYPSDFWSCGTNVSKGDFDSNGISDLVIGIGSGDLPAKAGAGYAYLLYGREGRPWANPYALGSIQ